MTAQRKLKKRVPARVVKDAPSKLHLSEWVILFGVLGLIISLGLISFFSGPGSC